MTLYQDRIIHIGIRKQDGEIVLEKARNVQGKNEAEAVKTLVERFTVASAGTDYALLRAKTDIRVLRGKQIHNFDARFVNIRRDDARAMGELLQSGFDRPYATVTGVTSEAISAGPDERFRLRIGYPA